MENNNWISIKQEEPPMYKDVLGYVVRSGDWQAYSGVYMVALLDGGYWIRYTEGSMPAVSNDTITHWMPLPKPPTS
jgi:Protein of unknown function (DUF551)